MQTDGLKAGSNPVVRRALASERERREARLDVWAAGAPALGATVTPHRLVEAVAIILVEVIAALPLPDRKATLETIANRLDGHARLPGGRETAALLGGVSDALMRLEG